jgi:hypothetical protein
LKKRISDLRDGFLKTHVQDDVVEDPVEQFLVEIEGGLNEMIDKDVVGSARLGYFQSQPGYLFFVELGQPGYLIAIVIEKRDAQEVFEIVIVIEPVIAGFSLWNVQLITMLPHTQGMCLYPTEVFYVPDSEYVHRRGKLPQIL